MRGSDFAEMLPESASEERDRAIYDAVRMRNIAPIEWSQVKTQHKGVTAYFNVSNDALRIGDQHDSFRATTSHKYAQLIADELHAFLPTAKLSDEIWKQADVRVAPQPHHNWTGSCLEKRDGRCIRRGDSSMAKTRRMLQQTRIVDNIIGGRKGLLADVGKDWVYTKRLIGRPKKAANYGWHGTGLPYRAQTSAGGTVWQPLSTVHHIGHVDYSQVIRLIQPLVKLCDDATGVCRLMHIQKIASDPEYSALVSIEGPLLLRHPGVLGNCPLRGFCPAPGTPMDQDDVSASLVGGLPCPDVDCEPQPPPQLPTVTPTLVAGTSTPPLAAILSVAAGAAVGYLAVRALMPRV